MASYRLDQYDRGTIELPSGQWRWFTIRVNSLPENVCVSQLLVFANESEAGDVMHVHVPNTLTEIDDARVRELAVDPDDREITTTNGTVVIGRRSDDAGGWWPVRPAVGQVFRTSTTDHRRLGELSRHELLEIARTR